MALLILKLFDINTGEMGRASIGSHNQSTDGNRDFAHTHKMEKIRVVSVKLMPLTVALGQ